MVDGAGRLDEGGRTVHICPVTVCLTPLGDVYSFRRRTERHLDLVPVAFSTSDQSNIVRCSGMVLDTKLGASDGVGVGSGIVCWTSALHGSLP